MSESTREVVAIGASAGGVDALRQVAAGLPAGFPAAVLVVMHVPPGRPSALADILDRAGRLPAVAATSGAKLEPGVIHTAPPDRHLLTEDGTLVLTNGPTENGHRPAINATFRSVALTSGARAIGVVLSGVLDDGAIGLRAIIGQGGLAVVQDPADAQHRGMPDSALAQVSTEHVLPADAIGPALDKLVRTPVAEGPYVRPPSGMRLEDRIARQDVRLGALSPATRPLPGSCAPTATVL